MAQRELWLLIKDQIGTHEEWPKSIKPLFWKSNLNHEERFMICVFVYINGLDPALFKEWCEMAGLLRDSEAWRHVNNLFDKFENSTIYDHYSQWHVDFKCFKCINGDTKYY